MKVCVNIVIISLCVTGKQINLHKTNISEILVLLLLITNVVLSISVSIIHKERYKN